jgi:arsenate reductase
VLRARGSAGARRCVRLPYGVRRAVIEQCCSGDLTYLLLQIKSSACCWLSSVQRRSSSTPPGSEGSQQLQNNPSLRDRAVPDQPFNALFLCTGNSARSDHGGSDLEQGSAQDRFRAYSAGSQPKGTSASRSACGCCEASATTRPDFRSKSWHEFARPGAPSLDFAFTVCDNAAGETCPVWPGQPMTAHWGVPDPAEAKGSEAEIALAFKDAYRMLHQRIAIFAALPLRSLDQLTLQSRLREIGRMTNATAKASEGA